jgi:hypothetical protein
VKTNKRGYIKKYVRTVCPLDGKEIRGIYWGWEMGIRGLSHSEDFIKTSVGKCIEAFVYYKANVYHFRRQHYFSSPIYVNIYIAREASRLTVIL